ncbi:MAG TPA: hypothetical protein PLB92_00465 [Rhodoglobus sp.]|nr:hypothetical protein [Rhodoglobus sp.]
MADDIHSGFTRAGAVAALDAVLGVTLYGKIHINPAFDGSLNPSVITTRQAFTYGEPDVNGVYDLADPFSFTGISTPEAIWGISAWTAVSAGACWMIRKFVDVKTVFTGDTLTIVSMPVVPAVVGL